MKIVFAFLFAFTLAACAPKAPERDEGPWQEGGLISKTTPEGVTTEYFTAFSCRLRVADGFSHYYTLSLPKSDEKRFGPFRQASASPANQAEVFEDASFSIREHRSFSTNNSRSGITTELLLLDADVRVETDGKGRRRLSIVSRRTIERPERAPAPYIDDWFSLFTDGIKAGEEAYAFRDTKDGVAYASPRLLPHMIEGTLVECR